MASFCSCDSLDCSKCANVLFDDGELLKMNSLQIYSLLKTSFNGKIITIKLYETAIEKFEKDLPLNAEIYSNCLRDFGILMKLIEFVDKSLEIVKNLDIWIEILHCKLAKLVIIRSKHNQDSEDELSEEQQEDFLFTNQEEEILNDLINDFQVTFLTKEIFKIRRKISKIFYFIFKFSSLLFK